MTNEFEWEKLCESIYEDTKELSGDTARAKIDGGWIYRERKFHYRGPSVSICFVPDNQEKKQ